MILENKGPDNQTELYLEGGPGVCNAGLTRFDYQYWWLLVEKYSSSPFVTFFYIKWDQQVRVWLLNMISLNDRYRKMQNVALASWFHSMHIRSRSIEKIRWGLRRKSAVVASTSWLLGALCSKVMSWAVMCVITRSQTSLPYTSMHLKAGSCSKLADVRNIMMEGWNYPVSMVWYARSWPNALRIKLILVQLWHLMACLLGCARRYWIHWSFINWC